MRKTGRSLSTAGAESWGDLSIVRNCYFTK